MKDLRTNYDKLKATYGDKLVTPGMLEKKNEELDKEFNKENETFLDPTALSKINFDEFMVGDVKLKDLVIAAINAIIIDNEQELYTDDHTIEVSVRDIMDYAGINLDDFVFNAASTEDFSIFVSSEIVEGSYDEHGNEYVQTFLEKLIVEALEEFGKRGWDVYLGGYDKVSREEVDSLAELVVREFNKANKDDQVELNDDIRLIVENIVNEEFFLDSTVTFTPEEKSEHEEYDDEKENEENDEPCPAESDEKCEEKCEEKCSEESAEEDMDEEGDTPDEDSDGYPYPNDNAFEVLDKIVRAFFEECEKKYSKDNSKDSSKDCSKDCSKDNSKDKS